MSDLPAQGSIERPPITHRDQLVDYFRAAGKPRDRWLLGTEHELVGVSISDENYGDAIAYEGERGIRALFSLLQQRGWTPVHEGDVVIGMGRGSSAITLEPGGQVELAAAPVTDTAAYADDFADFFAELCDAGKELSMAWLQVGFRPFQTLEQVPWVPKRRYGIMKEYLPTRGRLAHEMMKRTATAQVNLDYADADDARAKLRGAMSVTSILTAIYANSPIVDEKPAGYQSYRSRVWRDTDPDRCGILSLAFEDGDVFEAYTDWALGVPMFFVDRGGQYHAAAGMTFGEFLASGFRGFQPNIDDWALHLSTLFPEARLKGFLEVRSCDAGSRDMSLALGPLLRGLLYDDSCLAAATALTAGLSMDQRLELNLDVARRGLRAEVPGGRAMHEVARELVAIARDGVARQAPSELPFLAPVEEIVATGRTQADMMLDAWNASGGDRRAIVSARSHGCS